MISEVKWCFFYSYFVIYIFYLSGNNIEEWEAKDIGICAQKKLYKVGNAQIAHLHHLNHHHHHHHRHHHHLHHQLHHHQSINITITYTKSVLVEVSFPKFSSH